MYSFRCVGLAAVAAGLFAGSALAAGDATKGKVAYVKNGCYQCHNFVGQGGQAGIINVRVLDAGADRSHGFAEVGHAVAPVG